MKARLPTKIARAAHSPLRVNLLFNRSEALASYNKIPPININSRTDRKSTRLNSSHSQISYPVFCLQKTDAHRRDGLSGQHPAPPPPRADLSDTAMALQRADGRPQHGAVSPQSTGPALAVEELFRPQ